MINHIFKKIFGTRNDRELKRLQPYVVQINSLEEQTRSLSDDDLRQKTVEFKGKIERGATLEEMLPETFAVVREAARRTLNMRHFDVQLIGGVVLHEGKIAEMKTGEGKTLVATLPVYLNSLAGKGVHVVTVNDYLARRDSEWMGAVYKFLGLSVGVIQHGMNDSERQQAYGSDITYGTNNEYGFDYLRDNMKYSFKDYVQRELNYAIVDEVDSILIDEARTPLIISGPSEDSTDKYYMINKIIPRLNKEDYQIEEKTRTVFLTEEGVAKVEKAIPVENLYDPSNIELLHHVNQALKAHKIFKRDVDYVVKEDEVLIVDEFTGRLMPGRRYSDGLHQALEAKEDVKIESENQTLATITFQNYFRLYKKLAGMTGTADTEAAEFSAIYKLEVLVIPPNRPMIRKEFSDVIYRTVREKFNAAADEIQELHKKGQPVLVGTISIEKSERLSALLKKKGVPHNVLNAKHHEREAEIVAKAGRKAGVTIATNMAGRGTDIVLEEGVPDLGGLHIIGTERHESRRIDNQLRGRSGRQGDPGSSRFYLSLEDDLLRIFGSERISGIMEKLGMEEGEPIEHKFITRAVENAQKKVEAHNFDMRKHLLEYDDVMNKQRTVVYDLRRQILTGESLKNTLMEMVDDVLEENIDAYVDPKLYAEEWDLRGLEEALLRLFNLHLKIDVGAGKISRLDGSDAADIAGVDREGLKEKLHGIIQRSFEERMSNIPKEITDMLLTNVMLQTIDSQWKDHLLTMDHLKESVGLRGYAQKNPLNEYKKEGFDLFSDMVARAKETITQTIFHVHISTPEEIRVREAPRKPARMIEHRGEFEGGGAPEPHTVKREAPKVGRNDPCPCGSGKKYKKCCGASLVNA
ncbi:MAG: preprotein translocase subunit SecA [Nitrospinae bacterium]|nr:preprotein translocase subunit SecA [Nitrospinota bacterium]